MSEIKEDKELCKACAYFLLRQDLRIRDYSIEMLFSKGYQNSWTLTRDNWHPFKGYDLDDIDLKN